MCSDQEEKLEQFRDEHEILWTCPRGGNVDIVNITQLLQVLKEKLRVC